MSEVRALLRSAAALRREGKPALLATVAAVRGSSYRRPGARMLLAEDRWLAGSVSGGCLEGDVLRKGWWRTRDGAPVLVTYDATASDDVRWGFGLGCDGVVEVLLERLGGGGHVAVASAVDPLRFIERCHEGQRRGVLATVFRSAVPGVPVGARMAIDAAGASETNGVEPWLRTALVDECSRALAESSRASARKLVFDGEEVELLVEPVLPAPRLFVLGSGHDAVPVVDMARLVGWEVVLCDPNARGGTRERFAAADEVVVEPLAQLAARIDASDRPLAVMMAHHYERDREALRMLLASRARYIGVLGPQRRTARMLAELAEQPGSEARRDERVHAPVGLELGAESPQEIALAIVAEVQSVLTHAAASSLRLRPGPIHADAWT